ncbi:MAG: prepilin-type N-terminal cleavage/methylation domain-containing protein [Candidatus Omnitrophota bacterium]
MRKDALTLIEVMITLSILTIVFSLTFGVMRIYDISLTMGNTMTQVSAAANLALDKMREELMLSASSQITLLNDNTSPQPDELTFKIVTGLDSEQNIQWGDGVTEGRDIKYYIGNIDKPNQLIREAGTKTILANDITDLQFSLTGNSLRIDITAGRPTQRGIVPAVDFSSSTMVDFKN